jgi:hypothetical protein
MIQKPARRFNHRIDYSAFDGSRFLLSPMALQRPAPARRCRVRRTNRYTAMQQRMIGM